MDLTTITFLRGDQTLTSRWAEQQPQQLKDIPTIVTIPEGKESQVPDFVDKKIIVEPADIPEIEENVIVMWDDEGADEYFANLPVDPNEIIERSTEPARANSEYLAQLYNQTRDLIETEYVLYWDDDIVPPTDGVEKLKQALENSDEKVAGITSVYPSRPDPESAVHWMSVAGPVTKLEEIPQIIHRIYCGGLGFSIWKTEALKKIGSIHRMPGGVDLEPYWGMRAEIEGYQIHSHGGVQCQHG